MSVPPPNFAPPPAPQVGTIPLTFQSLKTVYAGSWRTMRQNPGAVFWLPMLLLTVAATALALSLGIWMKRLLDTLWTNFGPNWNGERVGTADVEPFVTWALQDMVLWVSAGMLVYSVCQMLAIAVTVAPTMRGVIGLPTRAGQAWRLVKPHVPRLLVGALVSWAVGVILMILLAWLSKWFVDATMATEFGSTAQTAQYSTDLAFGSTMFTFVAYFFELGLLLVLIRFIHTFPAMVLEHKSFFTALGRSWQLITGRYWQVLGTLYLAQLVIGLALGLLVSVVILLVMAVGASFIRNLAPPEIFNSISIMTGVVVWVSLIVSSLAYVLMVPLITLLYADNRIRKEGLLHELFPLAFNEPTLAAARNADPQALQLTENFVPGTIPATGGPR